MVYIIVFNAVTFSENDFIFLLNFISLDKNFVWIGDDLVEVCHHVDAFFSVFDFLIDFLDLCCVRIFLLDNLISSLSEEANCFFGIKISYKIFSKIDSDLEIIRIQSLKFAITLMNHATVWNEFKMFKCILKLMLLKQNICQFSSCFSVGFVINQGLLQLV